ncbi:hypothetical protein [Streptomyces naphthomycinicus]|uniref:hypothetical protein n=1 Tax=Streptomyces naphthomycinicus TaxID=2872625 RepID=UPI001CED4FD4|nr:hypothetical protein [Streptomyces sp. TML10]
MITVVYREDMPCCVRWEILMHERFSGVWICKDFGRTTTGANPTELGRAVLAAYLAGRPTRGETFRVVVHTDNGSQSVITPDQLAAPGWTADPAVCRALPAYLRSALA